MGLIAALNFPEGISKSKNTAIMKLILLTALAAVALAEPEADAYYGYGGYYGHGLYGYGYGHQLAWPSIRGPGFSSQCFGCRGKRSAEPSAEPHGYGFYGYHPYAYGLYHPYAFKHHVAAIAVPEGTGVGVHPGGATSFVSRSPQGLGKRSAEEAAPAEDDKVYGTGHNSYVGQTIWGFPKVKRSAEEVEAVAEEAPAAAAHVAIAHPYFGYYGHQLGWPSFRAPGFSSQCFGCRGKRSAEAEPGYGYYGYPAYYRGYYGYPYGLGVAGHPTGTSYSHRSPQGLGK